MGIPVPEGDVVKRPLQFFWLTDCSGSMSGIKIATLNQAIREAIPEVRKAVASHPEVQIMMRAIKFSDNADWHVGPKPIPIEEFVWHELGVDGRTATSKAIKLLASELDLEKMPSRGYPPICILISDGYCTDPQEEYNSAISELNTIPWGINAVRLAIAIGSEANYDEKELLKFVNHPEVGVLKADSPQKLVNYIIWASVAASLGATQGKDKTGSDIDDNANVILTPPAESVKISDSGGVF